MCHEEIIQPDYKHFVIFFESRGLLTIFLINDIYNLINEKNYN